MSGALIVLAPDAFKGSFDALRVAEALARGWRTVRPGDRLELVPLADGGEGTLVAIESAGGWARRTARVRDPLGRPIDASWLRSTDGRRAIVEMAEASGLSRVDPAERDAVAATSAGTGELIVAALDTGIDELLIGIGGSATTDGGRGLLETLGLTFDAAGLPSLEGLDPRLGRVTLRVACDVTNPLLGPRGAAATYGPQKGAATAELEILERRLGELADRVEAATGRAVRDLPGAGAAGGVGWALLSIAGHFRSFAFEPGAELVMAAIGFEERIAGADLVVTGEGRIDAQTAYGKTALAAARRAAATGVRCVAVGGSVTPEGAAVLAAAGAETFAVFDRVVDLPEAIAAGVAPIEAAGARLARLVVL